MTRTLIISRDALGLSRHLLARDVRARASMTVEQLRRLVAIRGEPRLFYDGFAHKRDDPNHLAILADERARRGIDRTETAELHTVIAADLERKLRAFAADATSHPSDTTLEDWITEIHDMADAFHVIAHGDDVPEPRRSEIADETLAHFHHRFLHLWH